MEVWHGKIYGIKLNHNLANIIRKEYHGDVTQISLAKKYGVGQDEISRIVNNKIWR